MDRLIEKLLDGLDDLLTSVRSQLQKRSAHLGAYTPEIWCAIFLGLAAPASVLGKGGVGVFAGLAFIFGLYGRVRSPDRSSSFGDLFSGAAAMPIWAITATLVYWLISSFFSADIGVSLAVWARVVVFFLGALVMASVLLDDDETALIAIKSMVIGCVLLFGYAAIATYVPSVAKPLSYIRTPQSDAVAYFKPSASVFALQLPLLIWSFAKLRGKWSWLSCAAIVAGSILIFGDGREPSRSALAGLFAIPIALMCMEALTRLSKAVRMLTSVLIVMVLFGAAGWFINALPSKTDIATKGDAAFLAFPDHHRQAIWGFVRDRGMEHPWLGHGIDTINMIKGAGDEVLNINQEFIPSHPHNWVLEVLAETGFPGLALSFIAILTAFFAVFTNGQDRRWATLPIIGCITVFLVSSLSNFSFWASWWQVGFASVLVMSIAVLNADVGHRPYQLSSTATRRFLGSPATALLVSIIIVSLLATLWWVRRTNEGRIFYKRVTAESPFVYDEVAPSLRKTDPAKLIDVASREELSAKRIAIRKAIWGTSDIPMRLNDVSVSLVTEDPPYLLDDFAPDNTASIERVAIPYEHGYHSVGYVIVPKNAVGRGIVYAHGYAGDISQAKSPIRAALALGYTIGLLNFPGYGENGLDIVDHSRFGHVPRDHDLLLAVEENPLRYYIDPIVVMADYLRHAHGSISVDAAGFSAGGWAVTVAAAADERFRRTFSVAGLLPLYLRVMDRRNQWPPPHLYPPLLQAANYLEMFVLAGAGEGRGYRQVFNRYDRCCYRNEYGLLYKDAVDERIQDTVGAGSFDVFIDETHALHRFSTFAGGKLRAFVGESDD